MYLTKFINKLQKKRTSTILSYNIKSDRWILIDHLRRRQSTIRINRTSSSSSSSRDRARTCREVGLDLVFIRHPERFSYSPTLGHVHTCDTRIVGAVRIYGG